MSEARFDWRVLPWGTFCCLTLIFWFASRANLFYSAEEMPVVGALLAERPDDWTKAVALAALAIFSGYTLWRCGRRLAALNPVPGGLLLAYIVWSLASVLWSEDGGLTARKLAPFVITWLAAAALSCRFGIAEIAALTFFSSGAMTAASLAAELALGTFRPWEPDYRFQGVWHPNMQAVNIAAIVLSGLLLAGRVRRFRFLILGVVMGAFGLLFLTRSRTAFASTVLSVAATWMLRQPAWKRSALTLAAAAILLGACFLASSGLVTPSSRVLLLGRVDGDPTTLTNRVPLWQECVRFWQEKPILGYGFGAFWTRERVLDVSAPQYAAWIPPSQQNIPENVYVDAAHSFYLETALGTGLVGALLFAGTIAAGIYAYALGGAAEMSSGAAFGFSVLLCVALNMLLEVLPLQPFLPLLLFPALLFKIAFLGPRQEESSVDTASREAVYA